MGVSLAIKCRPEFPAGQPLGPGYPLQFLIPLRSIPGFPLLSLTRFAPIEINYEKC